MINLKACERCGGDMIRDEYFGDVDLVCLQCGYRKAAPVYRVPVEFEDRPGHPVKLRVA